MVKTPLLVLCSVLLTCCANSAQQKPDPPTLEGAHVLGHMYKMHAVCGPCECHLETDRKARKVTGKTTVQESASSPEDNCHQLVERFVVPSYPPLALTARIQGTVFIQAEIDTEGNVIEAQPVEGHPMLCNAAQEAVQDWKFRPSETLVKMITIRFELSDNLERNPPRVTVNPPDELQIVAYAQLVETSVAKAKKRKPKNKSSSPKRTSGSN